MSQRLALIIGNSEYEDSNLTRLVTPGADVHAFAQVLRDPEIGKFDEVVEMVNQSSTSIRRAISSFFVGREKDDLLLLYFSGHGVRDDRGHLFLAVKDTEHRLLRGTAIPANFITEEMDNSRSRQQILVLDCCHSGAFSRGMKAVPGASVGTAAAFEGTGSGRVVLTASDSTQYAWEGGQVIGKAENSVFTHYLIQGLRTGEADTAGDGQVTLDELYDYVYAKVVHETPKQTPSKWSYGQQGEIIIARNLHPVIKPAELPADLQHAIEDPRPWVREGAVHELKRMLVGSNPRLALAASIALKSMADDDSRRIANMAHEALVEYHKAQEASEEVEKAEIKQTDAEQSVQAEVESEKRKDLKPKEYESREHDASEPIKPKTDPVEPLIIEKSDQELLVQNVTKHPQVSNAFSVLLSKMSLRSKLLTMISMNWRQILVLALGWGMSMQVGPAVGWAIFGLMGITPNEIDFYINGVPGYGIIYTIFQGVTIGLITGLVLRWRDHSIGWKEILVITIGWALSLPIGLIMSVGKSPFSINHYASWMTGGAIAGLITGMVLWWKNRPIPWKQVLVISVGWSIGLALYRLLIIYRPGGISITLANLIGGAISAIVGSSALFWIFSQMQRGSVKGE